ncbi:putative hyalin [Apostichopus japonicus]|uniref:Putative hyalin n=1 Tax=Stichopus japonicus TaxID=307972 RepID=A0A2G8LP11_STIJA|nr:putative hyalin [Apostichopus japonicus]
MDITREIELGSEDPVIFWIEPFATDIGEVTTVSTHQPATSFQVGSTLVTYTFTDDATPPNSEFCEFMVQSRQVKLSREFFLVGSTAVMYSISDASQNTAICTFTITISTVDTTPPSVTCPADITRVIELGEGGINVEWDLPSGTDLSEPVTIVSTTRQPGSFFTVGQIEITYVLTDAASNQNSCNFMVTVTTMDTIPPSIIGCPGRQEATIEFGLQGIEVSWIEPTAFDISNVANLVSVSAPPGSLFMVGDTNVTYVFADSSGNLATCFFIVTVLTEDTTPPEIPNCPNTIQETIELGSDDPIIVWVEPVATDLSGASVFSNSHTSGSTFQVGETVVTYLFSDPFGNMAVCSFSVVVNTVDTTPPVISNCPVNQDVVVELGDESGTAIWEEPTATDLSGVAILSTRTHIPGETFPVGQTVVMYIFTDPSMNSDLCQFVVIVRTVDSINPVCQDVPEGISVMLELGEQGVTVEWTPPTCFDLSGVTTLTPSHLSGSFFLIDTTTDVTFTCVDPAGLTGMCSFPVVIIPIDTTAPRIISCPSQESPTVTIELGEPGVMVTWQEPMVSDLSEVVLVSQSHMPNQFFVVGPTTVTYVYRDSSNNMANCQFVVSVLTVDTVAPIISLCPVEQTIQVELGVTSAVAFWVEPTATDVSGTATLLSRSNGPGESVPLGTTIVNYIFTDASSNTATCTFSITVSPVDTTPPVVVCTEDVPFEVELGTTGTIAVWTEPTATDISGVTSLTERSHSPGSFFSVGKTTVIYVFSDNTGNSATCIFCVCITTVDTTPPTCANVPQGVSGVVELGVTGTLVDWVELTCEDQSEQHL